jgi:hypothetical protein
MTEESKLSHITDAMKQLVKKNEISRLVCQAQECIKIIESQKLNDDNLISLLLPLLQNILAKDPNKVVYQFIYKGEGTLIIKPNDIYIDYIRITKDNVDLDFTPHSEQESKRCNQIKEIFELGNQKCVLSSCPNNDKNYYLKLAIKEHAPECECIYCYDCFKKLSIGYLNGFIAKKTDLGLWKCKCKRLIPSHYFHVFLEKQIVDYHYIINKGEKYKYFCVKCGCLTSINSPNYNNLNILCSKHEPIRAMLYQEH